MISRRSFTTLLGATILGGGLSAAGPARAATTARDTLNFLLGSDPGILTGIRAANAGIYYIGPKINEGLVQYDFDQNPQPLLAESWEIAPDARSFAFHLRKGVKWHDGAPFTAKDVAFSIRTLRETHPRGGVVFKSLTDVETPDEHTAVLQLSDPVPYLMDFLHASETPILPAHRYENAGDPLENPANNAPVGTGPFVFREWVPGSHVILERNPDYWDSTKPILNRIVYRFVGDTAARSVALETGEVDIGVETPIAPSEVQRLRALPTIQIESASYEAAPFYVRLEFRLDNEFLSKLKVRQAIAHAINQQAILDIAYLGNGSLATGPLPPTAKRFYESDVTTHPFDPARAEVLLDEAGFPRATDGTRFTLRLRGYPEGADHRAAAEMIKQQLIAVGIGIDHVVSDTAEWIRTVYTDRAFDLSFSSVSVNHDPAIGVQRLFWSKNIRPGVAFSNVTGYANPEVDRLLEGAAVEPDLEKRRELYSQFQKIVTEELPEVPLVALKKFTLANAKLKDFVVSGDGAKGDLGAAWFEA
ncbi:ABC transporter substrate-binding protein [Celeribacter indicus]|uniref:ABC transporter substrate binding protein n=1 Tax=Celeribacter indicus TaxID=1208324 RepID=A0A0B5E0H4_9RHOB|nr:ABC transporter substrate-binding protein [Celeribacter indicus]AJE48749.1 ABC transporter substrate binding protein [Celeribacter indicus]SDX11499.1 peptide/nickel transport system substrate-binding protein [Celeribacter indicus]